MGRGERDSNQKLEIQPVGTKAHAHLRDKARNTCGPKIPRSINEAQKV